MRPAANIYDTVTFISLLHLKWTDLSIERLLEMNYCILTVQKCN